ncbi:MAG TPA: DNA/RNA helicase domain-containing protein [Plantibacter sp.]|uniref:DNA/RNA helicase domain-containing protein n=2 Tax=unclassified Plantibacter TaxID=2624265 RepID=UPI002CA42D55|nr:DNA/RNA helicase domain-containing protein [Plantibacter sp.]
MTSSEITRLSFTPNEVKRWGESDKRYSDWPVVYLLDGGIAEHTSAGRLRVGTARVERDVYVGESLNVAARMRQHFDSIEKKHLTGLRVIVDQTFNKSVCLDLESFLIRLLAGDGSYQVLNRNDGIVDANYYERDRYRESFLEVFERLRADGVFTRSIPEIENSDLFKLSPFKALTQDQAIAVDGVLAGLFEDIERGVRSTTVLQGDPGTGKTVVAIYLLKLIADIRGSAVIDEPDSDTLFSSFFTEEHRAMLQTFRVGLVVPQQSLRSSIKKVFRKTPGLHPDMVLTAFDVGGSDEDFDLLVVDEAHRLNQRANQPSGPLNKKFRDITVKLFGEDDTSKTQLDWIAAKSNHQIFLLDAGQSVRPADVPAEHLHQLVATAKSTDRYSGLASQMRVRAGADYVDYIRNMLGGPVEIELAPDFGEYDLRMFDDIAEMREEIRKRDAEVGLARLVAGFAWEWKTKYDKDAYDIVIDDVHLRWNGTQTDWIASPLSLEEVGSIHTVQGYDLNYAGVIIGPDLRFDVDTNRIVFHRSSYFDKKGKENNPARGLTYSDDDLLRYVTNIYTVLLTRGIRGTYVYVSDPALRTHLSGLMLASS